MRKHKTTRRAVSLAIALFLTIGVCAPLASARQQDLGSFLVGLWRMPSQAGESETVFHPNGFFKTTVYLNGSNNCAYLSGGWEIRRGSELWTHNMAWYPLYINHIDGSRTPVHIQAWDTTSIEIIDANHFRTSQGVATRVG